MKKSVRIRVDQMLACDADPDQDPADLCTVTFVTSVDLTEPQLHRWARYFKKVVERALNTQKNFLSASALQGL